MLAIVIVFVTVTAARYAKLRWYQSLSGYCNVFHRLLLLCGGKHNHHSGFIAVETEAPPERLSINPVKNGDCCLPIVCCKCLFCFTNVLQKFWNKKETFGVIHRWLPLLVSKVSGVWFYVVRIMRSPRGGPYQLYIAHVHLTILAKWRTQMNKISPVSLYLAIF